HRCHHCSLGGLRRGHHPGRRIGGFRAAKPDSGNGVDPRCCYYIKGVIDLKRNGMILMAAIALVLAACRHNAPRQIRPAIDPELTKLTKEQIFDRGEAQFAKKRYPKARTYYSYIYENFPNDPLGRRALLRVADTYYAQGDPV